MQRSRATFSIWGDLTYLLPFTRVRVKFPLVTSGTFTNLCVHNRFAHQNVSYQEYKRKTAEVTAAAGAEQPIPLEADVTAYKFTRHEEDPGYANKGRTGPSFHSELIKQRLTTLIASAKNNVMVIHDLMCALVGWLLRIRLSLKGFKSNGLLHVEN